MESNRESEAGVTTFTSSIDRSLPVIAQRPTNVLDARRCGECQACCVVFTVPEMEKGRHERCRHQCETGCAIHSAPRPAACTDFVCEWLADRKWPEELRPDKCGIVFAAQGMLRPPYQFYVGTQSSRYAYLRNGNRRWIDRLKQRGHVVLILNEEGLATSLFSSQIFYPGLTVEDVVQHLKAMNKRQLASNAAFYRSRR